MMNRTETPFTIHKLRFEFPVKQVHLTIYHLQFTIYQKGIYGKADRNDADT